MPTFDQLNVTLSNRLGDAVAAAGTDGPRWSSANRVDFLNQAIRRWLRKRIVFGVETGQWNSLRDYSNEEAQSLVANVKALSAWTGGVDWILDAYDSTNSLPIKRYPDYQRFWSSTGGNSYLTASATNPYWTIDGSNFRLINGSTTSTNSITLRYIKQHTDLAAGGTIVVPSQYHGQIIDLATGLGLEDVPTSENVSRAALKENMVNREING